MLPDSKPQVNVRVMYASRGDTPSAAEREFFESLTKIIREQWKDLNIQANAKLIVHETPASLHDHRKHSVSETLNQLDASLETTEAESPIFHEIHDYRTSLRSNWLADVIFNTYIDDTEYQPESAKPKPEKKTQSEGEPKGRKQSKTPSKAVTQEIPLVFVSNPEDDDQLDSIREAQKTFADRLSAKGASAYFTLTSSPSNQNLSFSLRKDLNIAPNKNDLGKMEFEPLNHGTFQRIPRLKDPSTDLVSTYIRNLLLNTAQHLQSASKHIDILPPASNINALFKPIEGYSTPKFISGGEEPAAIKPKQAKAETEIREVTPRALAKPVPTIKTYITDERFDLIRSQISSGELNPKEAYNLHLPDLIHLGINQERRLTTLTEFLPNEDDLNRLKKLLNNEPFYDGKALPRALALALAYNPNEPKLGKLLEDPTTLNRIFTNISTTPGQTTIHGFQEDYASFSKLVADKAISPLVAVNIIANYNKSVAQVKELKLDKPTAQDLASALSASLTGKLSLDDKAQILGLAMTRLQNNGTLSAAYPDKTLRDLITSLQAIETQDSTATAASNGAHSTSNLSSLFTSVVAAANSAPVAEFSAPSSTIKAGRFVDINVAKPATVLPEPKRAEAVNQRWTPNAEGIEELKKSVAQLRQSQEVRIEELITLCQELAGRSHKITRQDAENIKGLYQIALGPKIAERKARTSTKEDDASFTQPPKKSPIDAIRLNLNKFQKPGERLLLKDLFFAHLQVTRNFLRRKELVEFRHQNHIEVADVPARVIANEHSDQDTHDVIDDAGVTIGKKAQAAKDKKAKLEAQRKEIEDLYRISPKEEKLKLTHLKKYTDKWRNQHKSLNIKDLTVIYIALTDRVPDEDKVRAIAQEYGISIDDNDTKHNDIYLAIAKDGLNNVLATDLKTPEAPVAPRPAIASPVAATPAPTQPAPPKTTLPTRTFSASPFAVNSVPAKPAPPQITRPAPLAAEPIVPKPTAPTANEPTKSSTVTTEPREKGHHVRTAIMNADQYEELKIQVTQFLADHNQQITKDELNNLIQTIIGRTVSKNSLERAIDRINLPRSKLAHRARETSIQTSPKPATREPAAKPIIPQPTTPSPAKPATPTLEPTPAATADIINITKTPFDQYLKGSFDLKKAIYKDCDISLEGYTFTPVSNVTQFALRLVKNELTKEDKEQLKSLNTLRTILNEICSSPPKSNLGLLVRDPEKYQRLIAKIKSLGHSKTTLPITEPDPNPEAKKAPVITVGDLRAKMTSALLMQSGPITHKLLDALQGIITSFRSVAQESETVNTEAEETLTAMPQAIDEPREARETHHRSMGNKDAYLRYVTQMATASGNPLFYDNVQSLATSISGRAEPYSDPALYSIIKRTGIQNLVSARRTTDPRVQAKLEILVKEFLTEHDNQITRNELHDIVKNLLEKDADISEPTLDRVISALNIKDRIIKKRTSAATETAQEPILKKPGRRSYIAGHEEQIIDMAASRMRRTKKGITLRELNEIIYDLTGEHYESFRLSIHAQRLGIPLIYDYQGTQTKYKFNETDLPDILAEARKLATKGNLSRSILNNIIHEISGVSLVDFELEAFIKTYNLAIRKDKEVNPSQTNIFAHLDVGNINLNMLRKAMYEDFGIKTTQLSNFTSFKNPEIVALLQTQNVLNIDNRSKAFSNLIDELTSGGNQDTLKSLLYNIASADKDSEIGQLIRQPQVYEDLIEKINTIKKYTDPNFIVKQQDEVPFARELKDFEAFRAVVKPYVQSRN